MSVWAGTGVPTWSRPGGGGGLMVAVLVARVHTVSGPQVRAMGLGSTTCRPKLYAATSSFTAPAGTRSTGRPRSSPLRGGGGGRASCAHRCCPGLQQRTTRRSGGRGKDAAQCPRPQEGTWVKLEDRRVKGVVEGCREASPCQLDHGDDGQASQPPMAAVGVCRWTGPAD